MGPPVAVRGQVSYDSERRLSGEVITWPGAAVPSTDVTARRGTAERAAPSVAEERGGGMFRPRAVVGGAESALSLRTIR
ncbi:predicted protein [Streptomyces sp. SPB78]|nr:predicted protein [Streptomyces sp. SPB78]